MRPLLALQLLALSALTAAAAAAAAPVVHLSEEHYRVNAQRGGRLVFPTDGRRLPIASDTLTVRCATGRLGASESWQLQLLPDGDAVVYFNAARNVRVQTPPCAAALAVLHDHVGDRQRQTRLEASDVRIERLDADSGGFVIVSSARAAPRLVVQHGVSLPIETHAEQQMDERQQAEREEKERQAARLGTAVRAAAFASDVDALAAVAARGANTTWLTAQRRQHYVDEFASASATADDFVELQRDHLELLLQEERELLHSAAAKEEEDVVEATWAPTFSLQHWGKLRRRTDAAARRSLAEGWVTLARLALAGSGDVVRGVNCLRRAVQWAPGFVPAYLELSALLVHHAGNESASCEAMHAMLARLEPDDFRASSSDMTSVLATNFSHCSVVLRMARLWGTSRLLRVAILTSVVLAFLHGVSMLRYCFGDKLLHFCRRCYSRRRRGPEAAGVAAAAGLSSARGAASGSGGNSRSRRAKRE